MLIIPVAGGLLLLLAALVLMVFLGLRGRFPVGEDNPGMHVEVVKVTPAVSTSPLLPRVARRSSAAVTYKWQCRSLSPWR